MKPKSKYTVKYERDESGRWVAEVKEVPGCLTQGRTIEQARERIREALQAWFDLPQPYAGEIVDDVALPPGARKAVRYAIDARQKAIAVSDVASTKTQEAVDLLLAGGLSLRDAGEVLGVSRQRIGKISKG